MNTEDTTTEDTTTANSNTADATSADEGSGSASSSTRRTRAWPVNLLIVLGALLLLVTSVNVWVKRAALNTDNWVDAADELIADPDVRSAVSVYVVDQLYANVDVSGELSGLLPSDLSGLSGPLAAALRNPATDAVDRLLSTQAAADVWAAANRVTHETIVRLLEDEGEVVSTTGGTVTLDLRELVVQLADTLGLPASVVDRIPPDVGQVTVVRSETLEDLQTAVTIIEWASWILFFVVLGVFALAIYLATDWRRVATRNVGLAILVVGLVVVAGRRIGGDRLLDSVVDVEENRPAADAVWRIGTVLLRDIGWSLALIGLVIVLGAVIAGPSRAAVALRRFITPALTGGPAIRWGIGVAVFLLILWWAPLPVLTTFLGMILLAAIIAASIEGLRGMCAHEAQMAERGTTAAVEP